jgi:hypothetical protein
MYKSTACSVFSVGHLTEDEKSQNYNPALMVLDGV